MFFTGLEDDWYKRQEVGLVYRAGVGKGLVYRAGVGKGLV